jgi:diamine N-acetyltransferase
VEPVSIRHGRPEDADAVAAFGRRTFDETFGPDNDPADHTAFLDATYGREQQARELEDPGWVTLLAETGDDVVGLAQLRGGQPPACVLARVPAALEVARLYVDRAWHGQGLAGRLLEALQAAARERGVEPLWLGVYQRNPRAIAFYERMGFHAVGEQIFKIGTDPQVDWVMLRASVAGGGR